METSQAQWNLENSAVFSIDVGATLIEHSAKTGLRFDRIIADLRKKEINDLILRSHSEAVWDEKENPTSMPMEFIRSDFENGRFQDLGEFFQYNPNRKFFIARRKDYDPNIEFNGENPDEIFMIEKSGDREIAVVFDYEKPTKFVKETNNHPEIPFLCMRLAVDLTKNHEKIIYDSFKNKIKVGLIPSNHQLSNFQSEKYLLLKDNKQDQLNLSVEGPNFSLNGLTDLWGELELRLLSTENPEIIIQQIGKPEKILSLIKDGYLTDNLNLEKLCDENPLAAKICQIFSLLPEQNFLRIADQFETAMPAFANLETKN